MLEFCSLGSGSSGNCTLVQASSGATTTRLLVDCGLGVRDLQARLERAGCLLEQIDAIFITHEHSDHIGCAASLVKRYGIPIWMSRGTYRGIGLPEWGAQLHFAQDMDVIECGALQIHPFTVPHDAKEPLQLCIGDGARKLGILTDLGHSTPHVIEQLQRCDALLLETNHDLEMLERGPYPAMLKKRVGGDWGHLNNVDAAAIAKAVHHGGLKHLVAAHLSLQNNTPDLARGALAQALGCGVGEVVVADAKVGTGWMVL